MNTLFSIILKNPKNCFVLTLYHYIESLKSLFVDFVLVYLASCSMLNDINSKNFVIEKCGCNV